MSASKRSRVGGWNPGYHGLGGRSGVETGQEPHRRKRSILLQNGAFLFLGPQEQAVASSQCPAHLSIDGRLGSRKGEADIQP